MPISYKVIGRHIRDARKSAGLTQEAAANQLGLSPEHYGKGERGERTVNLERLVQISHLYGTTVCALLEGFNTEAVAPVTQRPAEMDAFLSAMREIAGGCTERSRALMLRVCAEIAASDKN